MPIITLTLTTEMLAFFAISALLKISFVSWLYMQYRRKSRCLADIERMTAIGLATINDRRRVPRYRSKGIL